jgi:hypothetical protein
VYLAVFEGCFVIVSSSGILLSLEVESSSQLVESSSHVVKSSSHLVESCSHLVIEHKSRNLVVNL